MQGLAWLLMGALTVVTPFAQASEFNATAPIVAGPHQYAGVYGEAEGTPPSEAVVGVILYEETNGVNGLQVEWTCADGSGAEAGDTGYFCEDGSRPVPPDEEAFHQEYTAELE